MSDLTPSQGDDVEIALERGGVIAALRIHRRHAGCGPVTAALRWGPS